VLVFCSENDTTFIPPEFLGAFVLDQNADVGAALSQNLRLISREIILEVFQPVCSHCPFVQVQSSFMTLISPVQCTFFLLLVVLSDNLTQTVILLHILWLFCSICTLLSHIVHRLWHCTIPLFGKLNEHL